jgi:hypothetical protein
MRRNDMIVHFHNGESRNVSRGVPGYSYYDFASEEVACYEVPVTGRTISSLLEDLPADTAIHRSHSQWVVRVNVPQQDEDGDWVLHSVLVSDPDFRRAVEKAVKTLGRSN